MDWPLHAPDDYFAVRQVTEVLNLIRRLRDHGIAVIDRSACFVAQQIGVDVTDVEGARAFDNELAIQVPDHDVSVAAEAGKVKFHTARMSNLPQYEAITKSVPVATSPTLLVIDDGKRTHRLAPLPGPLDLRERDESSVYVEARKPGAP